ncbi:MAG: hypothetical protein SR1Q5_00920 [Quinella sp. 1Q5]|nr:hypothetical protein [Quinella sp. 1Q5]
MTHYHPYDPLSTIRVKEIVPVIDAKAILRHIPKKGSIHIYGFNETSSDEPQDNQFFCDYALDSLYRDSNRVLVFNPTLADQNLVVDYIAIGTVFTSDDANEIKAHLENQKIHGGGSSFQIGDGFYRSNQESAGMFLRDMADEPVLNSRALFQALKRFPMYSYDIEEGVNQGYFAVETLEDNFVRFVKRASRHGDLISFYQEPNSGGFFDEGWAFRTNDKWIILGYYKDRYAVVTDEECWSSINPLLTIKDRQKLDSINAQIDAWQYKGKFNNRPDSSDEDDTDIAIYNQCEDNDTFPDGSSPEVGYYSLQDMPFTYSDMAFHNDDLLFYLPLANGSKKWFVMQSAANYRDYYTYRHPTILPDYPARGTENTNDKRPPEGNLWFDEDGKLHLAGKDYNLYTFTPDPPANRFSANLSLTENDRKLLDYLHQKFDSEIP